MKSILEFLPHLSSPQKVLITHHYNADGDAIGSSLALYLFLKKRGHDVSVISPNPFPSFLQWMPSAKDILVFEKDTTLATQKINEADILFSLDYNNFSRTKVMEKTLLESKGTKVLIDHHLHPSADFEFGVSLPEKSSTCEMVYDFINLAEGNNEITVSIAQCIYSGAVTDTGSFKYASAVASTHLMVADLMQKGLEQTRIHELIMDTNEENRLRLLGHLLSKKMELLHDCHAAIISLDEDEQKQYPLGAGGTEGFVNYPLSLATVILSIFISSKQGEIRMSFRSKGNFDVCEFAQKHFEGGGHFNAAGGRSDLSIPQTIEKLNTIINENKKQLKLCYEELQSL